MVQTVDAMPSAPEVRNGIPKSVLRGTGTPPELFRQKRATLRVLEEGSTQVERGGGLPTSF